MLPEKKDDTTHSPSVVSATLPDLYHPPSPEVGKAVAEAMAAVEDVALDGFNQRFGYRYPSIAVVRGAAGRALAKAGVSIFPSITRSGRASRATSKGGQIQMTFVELLIHIVTPGGTATVRWEGQAEDVTDKGVAKAVSNGIKSFLQTWLLMGVAEDEVDADEGQVQQQAGRQPQQRRVQQAEQQAKRQVKQQPPPPQRPYPPDTIRDGIAARVKAQPTGIGSATQAQVGAVAGYLEEALDQARDWGADGVTDLRPYRLAVLSYLLARPIETASDLSKVEASAVLEWLVKDRALNPLAIKEIRGVLEAIEQQEEGE